MKNTNGENMVAKYNTMAGEYGAKLDELRAVLSGKFIGEQLGCNERSLPNMSSKPESIMVVMAEKIDALHAKWIK